MVAVLGNVVVGIRLQAGTRDFIWLISGYGQKRCFGRFSVPEWLRAVVFIAGLSATAWRPSSATL